MNKEVKRPPLRYVFQYVPQQHRDWMSDVAVALGVGTLIGLIVALGAGIFYQANAIIKSLWLPFELSGMLGWQGLDVMVRLASVTLIAAFLIILILWRYPGKLYGPAEAILSAQFPEASYNHLRAFVSTLVALIAVSAGGSVGQYGPLVIFGAAIAYTLAQLLSFTPEMRRLVIAAGAAAAISAAFGAPLGGIVFAHEVILRHYRLRSFATVSVASTLAFGFSVYIGAEPNLFITTSTPSKGMVIYMLLTLIGILGGGIAVALMRTVEGVGSIINRLTIPFWVYPIGVACLLTLVGSFAPQALGIGIETIQLVIDGQFTLGALFALITIKIVLSAICLNGGFHGGVFSPAMVVGALLGGLVALSAGLFIGDYIEVDTFVLVFGGIGAVVAPIIGGPMAVIIIVYELTSSHYTAAAMALSVVFSSLVVQRLYGGSFFVMNLKKRGFDLSLGSEERVLAKASVETLVEPFKTVISSDCSIQEAEALFRQAGINEAVVVGDNRCVVGCVTSSALAVVKPETKLITISQPLVVLDSKVSQLDAIRRFYDQPCDYFAFVDDKGCYQGNITSAALLGAYAKAYEQADE